MFPRKLNDIFFKVLMGEEREREILKIGAITVEENFLRDEESTWHRVVRIIQILHFILCLHNFNY